MSKYDANSEPSYYQPEAATLYTGEKDSGSLNLARSDLEQLRNIIYRLENKILALEKKLSDPLPVRCNKCPELTTHPTRVCDSCRWEETHACDTCD